MLSLLFTHNVTADSHFAQTLVLAFFARLSITGLTQGSTAQEHEEGRCLQVARAEIEC